MAFCTQCGKPVSETAVFCGQCGARQQSPAASASSAKNKLESMSPRTASILCYLPLLGWVMCLYVLSANRFHPDRTARFHAFQGLYLFVAYLIVDWGVGPFLHLLPRRALHVAIDDILKLAVLVASIYMMVKTNANQLVRLPLFGDLAERSVAEQR